MFSQNVIEPAQTEWSALIVFKPKEDKPYRFCFNNKKFSNLTRYYIYLIPRMSECTDSLGQAAAFSSMDAHSSNWLVETIKMIVTNFIYLSRRFLSLRSNSMW